MNTLKQDVKTALKTMGSLAAESLRELSKLILVLAVVILFFVTLGYFFFHYFFQSLIVLGMVILCTWFLLELDNAKKIREKEEQQEAYWAEKRKPAHPEYKEQL